MDNPYRSMYELMEKDADARGYFDALPDYVRDQISSRADNVNTFSDMRDYAENLLRGDI